MCRLLVARHAPASQFAQLQQRGRKFYLFDTMPATEMNEREKEKYYGFLWWLLNRRLRPHTIESRLVLNERSADDSFISESIQTLVSCANIIHTQHTH